MSLCGRRGTDEGSWAGERPGMTTRWRLKPFDSDRIASLARTAGITPLTAQLLINRGINEPGPAQAFLEAKLTQLNDPETCRVPPRRPSGSSGPSARTGRSSSTAITTSTAFAARVSSGPVCGWRGRPRIVFLLYPASGRGGLRGQRRSAATVPRSRGPELVVTVDCGISAVAEAELARQLGLELIVTDHHTIGSELPEADVIVHPRLAGEPVPLWRPLRGRGGVQGRLADLQELRRRQEGLAPPPRLSGPVARPGGAGDRRRRGPAQATRTGFSSGTV